MMEHNFDQLMIALMILLLFEIKSKYEEKKLTEHFPEYPVYSAKTNKFFPFI